MVIEMTDEEIGELDAYFLPAMEIFLPKHREELKYDLWNNKTRTTGEAIHRVIAFLQCEQNPPLANSLL